MIIQNIILYLDNMIRNKSFISKEMPFIGTLILQGNILGVKFNREFSKNSEIPQHRKITKKDIGLYMKPEENKVVTYNDIKDVDKALKKLRPYTSVNTKITKGASDWLKKNLDLDIDKILPDQKANPYLDEYNEFNKNNKDNKDNEINICEEKKIMMKTQHNFYFGKGEIYVRKRGNMNFGVDNKNNNIEIKKNNNIFS